MRPQLFTRTTLALALTAAFAGPALAQEEDLALLGGEDEASVLDGTKFAGQDAIELPGIYAGGGVTVLDPQGGTAHTYTSLRAGVTLALWKLKLGLEADMRFDDDFELRKLDWDEVSDWGRVVRFIQLGDRDDPLFLRAGRLFGTTLGHGSLVSNYQSALDVDSPKTGAEAAVQLQWLGIHAMTNDVTKADVIGVRGYVAPFVGGVILPDIRLTGQFAIDYDSPVALTLDEGGLAQLTSDRNYRWSDDDLTAFGGGVEAVFFDGDPFQLTPYAEHNFISGRGNGLHAGAKAAVKLPLPFTLGFSAKGEFRWMSDEYLPGYFDAQYELDRFRYPDKDSPITKRAYLETVKQQHGYMGEVGLEIAFVKASARFEGFELSEENNRLTLGLEVGGIPYVRARALYTRHGIRKLSEIGTFDERTTLTGEVLVQLHRFVFAGFEFQRAYELRKDDREYHAIHSYAPVGYIGWTF